MMGKASPWAKVVGDEIAFYLDPALLATLGRNRVSLSDVPINDRDLLRVAIACMGVFACNAFYSPSSEGVRADRHRCLCRTAIAGDGRVVTYYDRAGLEMADFPAIATVHRTALARLLARLPLALGGYVGSRLQPWLGLGFGALSLACLWLVAAPGWWPDLAIVWVPPLLWGVRQDVLSAVGHFLLRCLVAEVDPWRSLAAWCFAPLVVSRSD